MEFVLSFLPNLSEAFGLCWQLAYLAIAALCVAEAWRALCKREACAGKIGKALAYCVITAKALLG